MTMMCPVQLQWPTTRCAAAHLGFVPVADICAAGKSLPSMCSEGNERENCDNDVSRIAPDAVASAQSRGDDLALVAATLASIGAAIVAALLSLSVANAESASDNTSWSSWADTFTKSIHDQTANSGQTDWSDVSALGYARSARSDAAAVRWLPPQPLPAVDGINAKIDGYGGDANHSNGFYGANGSLSVPLAQQWGLQLDGGVGSQGAIGSYAGAGHLFWRDPSIGLLEHFPVGLNRGIPKCFRLGEF